MQPARLLSSLLVAIAGVIGVQCATPAVAWAQNNGFQIGRYEPTPAGEWSFMVDHPWFSGTRYFAGGFTLDYGHNPFVLGRRNSDGSFAQINPIISTQVFGHFDFAGSFLDRVTLALTLPVMMAERGQATAGVAPSDGGSIGDPRFGAMFRIWGQPDASPFSVSAGAAIWFPIRRFTDSIPPQESDQSLRFSPKVVLGGLFSRFRWAFTFAFLYRAEAVLGPSTPVGSELQFGFAGSYADLARRFAIGPEILLSSIVTTGSAFQRDATSLEMLIGAHYNLLGQVQIGAAVGMGVLRNPGTPDVRMLLRIAYAPMALKKESNVRDRDRDGIVDAQDACPDDRGMRTDDPKTNGCAPPDDQDSDGIVDAQDVCPRIPRGDTPDDKRPGCPSADRDGDGIADSADKCPDAAVGDSPDPDRLGCPNGDQDGDGVNDREDVCPQTPKGERPDASRPGCPMADRDADGVIDSQDQCPDVAAGNNADPSRLGCPTLVPIVSKPTVTAPPKDNTGDAVRRLLAVMRPIFFKRGKTRIEPRSEEQLAAIAEVLKSEPALRKLVIRGHADSDTEIDAADELARQRAEAVARWLTAHGVESGRLETKGFGAVLPFRIGSATSAARAPRDRRADFRSAEPSITEAETVAAEDRLLTSQPSVDEPHQRRKPRKPGAPERNQLDEMLDQVEKAEGLRR